ncbi:nucleolin-like [Rhopilema esculentum]|uniref:nucleolin-like n=1 Tax=Rhopilema esculentum TaxID=499914 RepID=UPI0031E042BE
MDLKFLGIFLLLAVAAYAAPSMEVEESEDPVEADALEDVMEDDSEEDLAADFELDEEDPRRRKSMKRPYFSKGKYCVCSKKQKKGDEAEVTEEDVEDHIDDVAENVENALADPRKRRRRRPSKKNWKLALRKLVSPFFRAETLGCYCTRNRAVVRLLNYLHLAHYIHLKQKKVFIKHVKYLVAQVKKQRRG